MHTLLNLSYLNEMQRALKSAYSKPKPAKTNLINIFKKNRSINKKTKAMHKCITTTEPYCHCSAELCFDCDVNGNSVHMLPHSH